MTAGSKPAARITMPIYRITGRRDRKLPRAEIGSGPTTRGAPTRTRVAVAIMAINKANRVDSETVSNAAGIPRADRAIISSAATAVSAGTAVSARAAAGKG